MSSNDTNHDHGDAIDPVENEVSELAAPPADANGRKNGGSEPPAKAPAQKGRGVTAAVAWLALLIAVLAVAAFGLDFLQDRSAAGDAAQSSSQLRALEESARTAGETLASLEQAVAAMTARDAETGARLQSFERTLESRLRQLDTLPGRVSTVESSLSSLQGISTGARDAWLLAEAEYYMQIGNAQLQLAGNPQLARIALTHADERIRQLGDPRLTGIRQALSDELRALEVVQKPDVAGITLKLASLAGVVDSLPLKQETVVREPSADGIDGELTGVDRALASLRNAVTGIVSVRRADEAMQPLIAPEAQYFLRANLALQLQAARLAMLRGEEAVFRQSLDDADAWLSEYYVAGSPAVRSARATIGEIRGSVFTVAMPDISLSLRLLRQFNALEEAGETGSEEIAEQVQ